MPADRTGAERIATAIKERRLDLRWSQERLARESGVSLESIKRYENAKTPNPDWDNLRAIFTAIGIPPIEIPILLGFVTRDELDLPPEPRRFSASTEEIIGILEDPDAGVSDDEKMALVQLLRARRETRTPDRPGGRRRVG